MKAFPIEWICPWNASRTVRISIKKPSTFMVIFISFVFLTHLASEVGAVEYQIGVDYHAVKKDFLSSAFVKTYHDPAVRSTVFSQLQSMADSGAQIIQTTLWQVQDKESYSIPDENWRLGFPLSNQDLKNIQTYAKDVASIQAKDGHYLNLHLTMGWLGCADYTFIHTPGTITWCDYSWSTFRTKAKRSIQTLLKTVGSIKRPDGQKVVKMVYLELEVMIGAKLNQDQFLKDLYPYFLEKAKKAGLPGSIYFTIASSDHEILDDTFYRPRISRNDYHRSLYWIYRSTQFMLQNGLPVPDRLDFSFYPGGESIGVPGKLKASYPTLIGRVWDDIQAVYPGKSVGVVETYYFKKKSRRAKMGQAFAQEFVKRSMPEFVIFWTTPDSGGPGVHAGFPFDFSSYQPH